MASQRVRVRQVLCTCLLLVGQLFVRASGAGRDCQYADSLFRQLRAVDENGQVSQPDGVIYDKPMKEEVDGVCKLDTTCCSLDAETTLKLSVTTDYEDVISTAISDKVMKCYNHSFFGAFHTYIGLSKDNAVQTMVTAYGTYFDPYRTVFDDFYAYLQQSVLTGNVCELGEKFQEVFFKLFLAAYLAHPLTGSLPETPEFQQCFYNYFLAEKSADVNNYYRGFTRSYNRTMQYLRALRTADVVLEDVLGQTLSRQCKDSLMRMSYCSACAGYESPGPCYGNCLNTMRGCLVDLSDLSEPLQQFSEALIRLKSNIESSYNPWTQFSLLQVDYLDMVGSTFDSVTQITDDLSQQCDHGGRLSRSLSKRQSGGLNHPTREVVDPPVSEMNASAYCFLELRSLFTGLPEELCLRETVDESNENCWNGQTIGSYERVVVPYTRDNQTDNPEVILCSPLSRYGREIAQLKQITRELDILTGDYACPPDDEDCSVDTNTCDYQIPFVSTQDVVSSAFGESDIESSGCSSTDGCFVDPCAEVMIEPSTTIMMLRSTITHPVVIERSSVIKPPIIMETPVTNPPVVIDETPMVTPTGPVTIDELPTPYAGSWPTTVHLYLLLTTLIISLLL